MNEPDENGITPLIVACYNGTARCSPRTPDVIQADENGITPLCAACNSGHSEVVTTLLAANADVDQADTTSGLSPLYIACWKGHTEVGTKLLAANANVNQATYHGETPLFVA